MLFLYESVGFDYISGGSLEPLLVTKIYDDHTIKAGIVVKDQNIWQLLKVRKKKIEV